MGIAVVVLTLVLATAVVAAACELKLLAFTASIEREIQYKMSYYVLLFPTKIDCAKTCDNTFHRSRFLIAVSNLSGPSNIVAQPISMGIVLPEN